MTYDYGKENTSTVIDVAWETLAEGGVEALVAASTRGETALALARSAFSVDILSRDP